VGQTAYFYPKTIWKSRVHLQSIVSHSMYMTNEYQVYNVVGLNVEVLSDCRVRVTGCT
jgi:hypothetical protein